VLCVYSLDEFLLHQIHLLELACGNTDCIRAAINAQRPEICEKKLVVNKVLLCSKLLYKKFESLGTTTVRLTMVWYLIQHRTYIVFMTNAIFTYVFPSSKTCNTTKEICKVHAMVGLINNYNILCIYFTKVKIFSVIF
jgi:hypothetical protein